MKVDYVISDFFNSLDTCEYEKVLEYFDENSVWERKGEKLVGVKEIKKVLESRSHSKKVIHQISNLTFNNISDSIVNVNYLITAYESDIDGYGRLVCHRRASDDLNKIDGKWIFLRKYSYLIMKFDGINI